MRRLFKERRPLMQFAEELDVLKVKQSCDPEIIIRLRGNLTGNSDEIFKEIEERSKFPVKDIVIEVEEVGMSGNTVINITSDKKKIDLIYVNHISEYFRDKYNVVDINIAGSIEREPNDVGIPDTIDFPSFEDEPTEVSRE